MSLGEESSMISLGGICRGIVYILKEYTLILSYL